MLVYRILKNNPADEDDMKSQEALGVVPRRPLLPEDQAGWAQVSTFATLEGAVRMARERPRLGAFIAELDIGLEIEHSDDPDTGHVGLIDTQPAQLLGCVRSVWGVNEVQSEP